MGSELEEVEGRMLWSQRAARSKQDAMAEVYNAQKGYKEVKASFAFHVLSPQKIKEMMSWNAV